MRRACLVLALAFAATARAQEARVIRQRLQVAAALRDSASRALTAYRLQHPPKAFTDTFLIPGTPIKVMATPEIAAFGRDAAAKAGNALAQQLGDQIALLTPAMYFVRTDSTEWRGAATVAGQIYRGHQALNRETPTVDELAATFASNAKASLLDRLDSTFRRQLAGSLPLDTVTDDQWSAIRLEMATSYAKVSHQCLDLDLMACEKILGLVPVSDPAVEFMDPDGRRAFVTSMNYWSNADNAARHECLTGNDATCLELVRRESAMLVLGGRGTASLTAEAMRMGGSGSLARMLNGKGGKRELIAAIAGQPVDSVVASWVRKVRGRGTVSSSFTPLIALASIIWIAAFIFLAMRSSRWR